MARFRDTGDEDAFNQIILGYSRQLKQYFKSTGRCSADADDLVQEVFMCIFRFRHQYETGKPFNAWIYSIATRRMRDLHKHSRRKRRVLAESLNHVNAGGEYTYDPPDESPASEFDGFDIGKVRSLVEHLPKEERVVIEAVFFQGLSWRQASTSLGISHGTFCTTMTKAMQRLREWFKRSESSAA